MLDQDAAADLDECRYEQWVERWGEAEAENLRLQALEDAASGTDSDPDAERGSLGAVTPEEPGAAAPAGQMAEAEEERE